MANRKRKCLHCKEYVTEWVKLPVGVFCSRESAIKWSLDKRDKDRAKEKAKTEKEIKTRNNALKKKVVASKTAKSRALESAQALARISRADNDGYCTCVTCSHVGKWNEGFDGGHFIAKGNCSYWMLDPRNIWPQCKSCNGNGMQYGNKEADYTLFMIDEFGREFVDYMKSMEKTVIKRSAQDYEDFIIAANKEILEHKKRIGIK